MTDTAAERTRYFDSLFAEHIAGIASYCRWHAGSPNDAQDAVSEVFLVAWRRLDEVPRGAGARPWLYATARRVMSNQARANTRRRRLQEKLVAPPRSHTPTEENPVIARVHAALSGLAPRDREVLLLAEWEGLTAAEIAAVVQRPAVTVRGRLHRARRRFRAAFEAPQTPSTALTVTPSSQKGTTPCRRTSA